MRRKHSTAGFTLLELLITVAIIGILAALAMPVLSSYAEKARVSRAISDIKTIESEILVFRTENMSFPPSLSEIGRGDFLDPWGNSYRYLRIAGGGLSGVGALRKDHSLVPLNSDYDLYSMGPDGVSKPALTAKPSWDDIIRANDGGYVGRADHY